MKSTVISTMLCCSLPLAGCLEATILTPSLLDDEESFNIGFPGGFDCGEYVAEFESTFINFQLAQLCSPATDPPRDCLDMLNAQGVACGTIIDGSETEAEREAMRQAALCYFVSADPAAAEIGLTGAQLGELFDCALPAHAFETLLTNQQFAETLLATDFVIEDFVLSANVEEQAGDLIALAHESDLNLVVTNHDVNPVSFELRFAFTEVDQPGDRTFYNELDPVAAMNAFWQSYGFTMEVDALTTEQLVFGGDDVVEMLEDAFREVDGGSDATIHMAFFNEEALHPTTELEISDAWIYIKATNDIASPLSYLFF